MKNRIQLIGFLAILLMSFSACTKKIIAHGPVTTQVHDIGGYDKIIISHAINAEISFTTGPEQVTVEANSNLHQYIQTKVIGNDLYIGIKNNVNIKGNYTLNVYIATNDFNALDVSGASKCAILNNWNSNAIDIAASGASEVTGSITSGNCDLELSGASKVSLTGSTGSLNMDLSGASILGGFSFQCDALNADFSGASNAELTVNGTLNLNLSGASTLRYMGQGVIEHIESSGSSSVIHL